MKTLLLLFVYLLGYLFAAFPVQAERFRILILLPNKYGANFYLNKANFENYGWDITIAGTAQNIYPCPAYGGPLGCPVVHPDTLIQEISSVLYWDCLAVMSGSYWADANPCGNLLASQPTLDLVHHAADSGLIVSGFCTGVRVLAAANVISGKTVTGNPNFVDEYIAAGAIWAGDKKPPQIDGRIVTTTAGDFYNIQNCAALLRAAASELDDALAETGKEDPVLTDVGSNYTPKISSIQWSLSCGTPEPDGSKAITGTLSDGFVAVGYTYEGTKEADVMLTRIDALGSVTDRVQLEEPGWQFAQDIVEDEAGGFLVAGFGDNDDGNFDLFVMQVDASLQVLWKKTYGGDGFDVAQSICRLHDGTIAVAGYTESFGAGIDDIYVIRMTASGDTLWTKTIGTVNSEMGMDVIETADHHILLTGNTGSFPPGDVGNRNAIMIKLTPESGIVWQKSYDSYDITKHQEWGVAVTELEDGGLVVVGHRDSLYKELKDGLVIKTTANGTELWRRSIGESTFYDGLESVIELDGGNLLMCGMSSSPAYGNDGYLVELSQPGEIQEKTVLGDAHPQFLHQLIPTEEQVVILSGQTWSADSLYNNWLISWLADSTVSVNHPGEQPAKPGLTVFPNPVTHTLNIRCIVADKQTGKLQLFDATGKLIKDIGVVQAGVSEHVCVRSTLIPSDMVPGVLYIRLTTPDATISCPVLCVSP